jgi:CubicO group peptidase (beta-lactamase class C family)
MFMTSSQWRPHLHLLTCALTLLLGACTSAPSAAPFTIGTACRAPQADADWPVSSAAASGIDTKAMCLALEQATLSPANIHAVLIERHARLVGELYRTGPDLPISFMYGLWHPFAPDTAFDARSMHDVRSVSKSIVGLLYGIALQQGKAPSLETPVLHLYPDLHGIDRSSHEAIQIRDLLTMSSGLDWHEWGRGALDSDETALYWKSSLANHLFDRQQAHPPGSTFNYNGGGTSVLADVLATQSGQSLIALARIQLFEPLGIRQWTWVTDLHDRPLAFSGLRMRPRDMLKIGRLINNKGVWHGRQIVPASWIEESTRTQIDTRIDMLALGSEPVGYGYQWWTGQVHWKDRVLNWASAMGNGGQRIFVVPELDLSIVLTAGEYGTRPIHDVENKIISAIVDAVVEP